MKTLVVRSHQSISIRTMTHVADDLFKQYGGRPGEIAATFEDTEWNRLKADVKVFHARPNPSRKTGDFYSYTTACGDVSDLFILYSEIKLVS